MEALALARSCHSRLVPLQAVTVDHALAPPQCILHLLQHQDAMGLLALPPPQRQDVTADHVPAR